MIPIKIGNWLIDKDGIIWVSPLPTRYCIKNKLRLFLYYGGKYYLRGS